MADDTYFAFGFDPRFRLPLALAGITTYTAGVRLSADTLLVRYGLFKLETPLGNVLDARVTGPYKWWRSLGPHLSGCDSGITFGTSTGPGVCLLFRERVRVVYPHEGATVTLADPHRFVALWRELAGG